MASNSSPPAAPPRRSAAAGLKVTDVSELTGFPEMMDGRVKTLHPKVHGGLLAIRDNAEHAQAMKAHGIAPIDLLVVNLYPFEATVDKGAGFEECIENIDIGGPAMIRAAAKNHDDVAVVVESQDYQAVLDELAANQGATTLALRRRLAAKAYARTAAYDAAISNWFAGQLKTDAPDFRAFGGRLIQALRYGENPHQTAAFYRTPDQRPGVATARQLQGKELSYNNINDTDAAYECVAEFDADAHRGLRHHQARQSLRRRRRRRSGRAPTARRWPATSTSAFGGIVARQPHARCGSRARDHRNLHRSDHRARRDRGGHRDHRRARKICGCCWPAALPDPRAAGPDREDRGRRLAGAEPRQRRGRRHAR